MDATGLHVDATVGQVAAAFRVPPGRVVALGGDAAAATAIVRAIAGRLPVDAGAIAIDGVTVSAPGLTLSRERRRVGAVFEGYRLSSRLTVRDHVATVFRRRGAVLATAREAARPWLERFELDHLANLRPADLQPPQRLGLALARALAADPAVLVLDDPLAPLEARTRAPARADLARLLREFGRPVVVATRDPDDVAALAAHSVALRGWSM
jgi:molybdate transport system ATP-binding protein